MHSLHNDGGIEGPLAKLVDIELADFQRLVRVNYQGVFFNLREMPRAGVGVGVGVKRL